LREALFIATKARSNKKESIRIKNNKMVKKILFLELLQEYLMSDA
jgi:hypothetical protein